MWRSGFVVGLLVVAGCSGPPPAPQGEWSCISDDGRLFVDVAYVGDGMKRGTARMTQSDGALDFDVQMTFQGIWALKADKLTESMTVEIVSAIANGAPMPVENQAVLRNGFGAEQVATVKVTGPDAMALINDVYGLSCTRA
ncbi:MAG: hypothetical protein EON61_01785 [Alphaproteobacteria bacterium]|jgi:hypothetical protein|nr:MAG: hypothetical protein EON61_01785 [Alphaproteobacteria bacterium]